MFQYVSDFLKRQQNDGNIVCFDFESASSLYTVIFVDHSITQNVKFLEFSGTFQSLQEDYEISCVPTKHAADLCSCNDSTKRLAQHVDVKLH